MECIICNISKPLELLAGEYSISLFNAISPVANIILKSFISLWFLYIVIFNAILKGNFNILSFFYKMIVFSLVFLVLMSHVYIWDMLYLPFSHFVENMVGAILSVQSKQNSLQSSNIAGIVAAIDGIVQQIFKFGFTIMSSYNPFQIIAGLIIVIVYILVSALSLFYILEYIFIIFLLSSFSPLFILCLCFDVLQPIFFRTLKILCTSGLTVFFSVAGVSLILFVLQEISFLSSGAVDQLSYSEIHAPWGKDFLVVLILGVIAILQQIKVKSIASDLVVVNIKGVSYKR